MALRVRIEPVQKSVEASIRADLSPAVQKKEAAAFAQKGIDEATAKNRQILGREPPLTITVDGRKGVPLETVNPDGGTIIAEWELVDDLLRLRARRQEVVLVSSGAIALGRRELKLPGGPLKLEQSQAAAAVGQIALAHIYKELFAAAGVTVNSWCSVPKCRATSRA